MRAVGAPFKCVRVAVADLYPAAKCDEPDCDFDRQPGITTMEDTKWHVQQTGHAVLVTRETRSKYRGTPR